MNDKPSSFPAAVELDSAFEALKNYDSGSPRGVLCALDEGFIKALPDPALKRAFENRLVSSLKAGPSAAATEYICSKLALCGSDLSVPALAELLKNPVLSTPARNALEKIPGNNASKALRLALSKLQPAEKAGAIQSLGARRDRDSVSILARCLTRPDLAVARAAAAALGEIGSIKASVALRKRLGTGPSSLQAATADAALVCAERLATNGESREASSLYRSLITSPSGRHVQQAASRGLANCAPARSHNAGT